MSRVFSAMTGTGSLRSTDTVEVEREDEEFVEEDAEATPFVEIGGPGGPVFSAASAKTAPTPVIAPEAKLKPDASRAFPRIAAPVPAAATAITDSAAAAPSSDAPTASYLSVRFHDASPRPVGRTTDGPDAGLVALHYPDHPVSNEYRTLRDEILRQLPEATSRVLTFAAASPEAGTTTVVLNLGVTLAREGQRVLVLDTNVTRPGVSPKLALRAAPGLAEVLGGHIPLTWALQPTVVPTLQALTAGAPIEAAGSDVIGAAIGQDLPKLIGQLRQWFDWVLIDSGVWGVIPERDATCPVADVVYLVTRETDANRPEFIGLRTWVKQLGGALRGFVTTRA